MADLKRFRKQNGLLQADVAKYLGVTREYISLVESGKSTLNDEKLGKLRDNENGWDVTYLEDTFTKNKSICGPSSVEEALLRENAQLRDQVAKLEEQNGKFWAMIEKLTNKQ